LPEYLLCAEQVVRSAEQPQIASRRRSALCVGPYVVDFDLVTATAPATVLANPRTCAAVTFEHLPPHFCRDRSVRSADRRRLRGRRLHMN
jgi:hypothetical protein